MQTFLPYPSFEETAKCLDYRRLGKQRVECLQILNVLKIGPYIKCEKCYGKGAEAVISCLECNSLGQWKTPWYNHPAVSMWRGFEKSLAIYGLFICAEWVKRGYKDSCFDKIHEYIPDYVFTGEKCIDYSGLSIKEYPSPKWLGDENFHLAYKSNLIKKNPLHYRPIFGIDILDNLPYIWPK